jgi:hypothetical protein
MATVAVIEGRRDPREDPMRRISALVLLLLLSIAIAAPVSAVTTIPVKAFVKENFERAPSDEPCVFVEQPLSLTCFGRGNAGRFGPITSVVVFTETSITRTITGRDGSTITFAEVYPESEFYTPGNSANAPGSAVSFGNPLFGAGTWTVTGATGNLTGATGSGTIKQLLAGNTIQIWFEGTITLP